MSLEVLMALRVQGIATVDRAATATGLDDSAATLASFVERGLAKERTGRIEGFTLTPEGLAEFDKLLAEEGLKGHEGLLDCYERFLGLNKRVLRVSSDWQMRKDGGTEVPNDHSDPSYDDEVIDRLLQIHERAADCLAGIASCAPRFAPYGARLESCIARLRDGDRSAFTAPLAESYHTVWFELHQDLLLTLGLERET